MELYFGIIRREIKYINFRQLVESEDSKTIYQFLNESLRNQKKISIETDLKHEYRESMDKLK